MVGFVLPLGAEAHDRGGLAGKNPPLPSSEG